MKIILHGATDCGSSNYGDFLYGKLIYDYLQKKLPDSEIKFYNPSDYFEKYINPESTGMLKGDIKSADVAIYIPGGYFGEGHNAKLKETIVQYMRFIPFGLKAVAYRKPLAIIGVGAGPNNNYFFAKAIKFISNHAKCITVRDEESLNALNAIGCKNVHCYTDPILAFNIEDYDSSISEKCKKIEDILQGQNKKAILVHFNHSKMAAHKFGEAIRLFINEHPEYYPVVSADQLLLNGQDLLQKFEKSYQSKNYLFYEYDDPFDFGKLVSLCDSVLTCKLHVGVTASQKEKDVLAVAVHPEKTIRFYKQINTVEHFADIESIVPEEIAYEISKLCGENVKVPQTAVDLAKQHLVELDNFMSKQMPQD